MGTLDKDDKVDESFSSEKVNPLLHMQLSPCNNSPFISNACKVSCETVLRKER
jgi:hypothetical protein